MEDFEAGGALYPFQRRFLVLKDAKSQPLPLSARHGPTMYNSVDSLFCLPHPFSLQNVARGRAFSRHRSPPNQLLIHWTWSSLSQGRIFLIFQAPYFPTIQNDSNRSVSFVAILILATFFSLHFPSIQRPSTPPPRGRSRASTLLVSLRSFLLSLSLVAGLEFHVAFLVYEA